LIRFSSAFLRLLHAAAAAAVLPIYIYFLSVILYNDNEEYAARETVPERHASLDSWMTFSSRCCCCCLLGDTLTKKKYIYRGKYIYVDILKEFITSVQKKERKNIKSIRKNQIIYQQPVDWTSSQEKEIREKKT
jgi:hypothetical protein